MKKLTGVVVVAAIINVFGVVFFLFIFKPTGGMRGCVEANAAEAGKSNSLVAEG